MQRSWGGVKESGNKSAAEGSRGTVRERTDLHLFRKTWHMSMGLLMAMIYQMGMHRATAVLILGVILSVLLILEHMRLRHPAWNEIVIRLWKPLIRKNEINQMSGIPYYIGSTIIAVGVFPQEVAVLAILYLAFGDPIASFFGIKWGDRGPKFANGKSWIGTAAGISACVLVGAIYLASSGMPAGQLLLVALLGGIVGGTVELLPLEIDDNFSIPVISGFMLWLFFMLFGL